MVVYGNRKVTLGGVLSNHIVIKKLLDFLRFGHGFHRKRRTFATLLGIAYNLRRTLHAFIADATVYAGDEKTHLLVCAAAETACPTLLAAIYLIIPCIFI